MKKVSVVLSLVFLSITYLASGQACDITPVAGKTYVAGFCIELVNVCNELPEPEPGEHGLPGDCIVEKGEPIDPGIG